MPLERICWERILVKVRRHRFPKERCRFSSCCSMQSRRFTIADGFAVNSPRSGARSVSRVSFSRFVRDCLRRARPRVQIAEAPVASEDVTQMVARLECGILAVPVHGAGPDINHRAPRGITISSARRGPKRHRRGERSTAQCQFQKGLCHTVPHWFPVVLNTAREKQVPKSKRLGQFGIPAPHCRLTLIKVPIAYRSQHNSGSLAIFAAIRRASVSTTRKTLGRYRRPPRRVHRG
jgi:hypothetical protein